VTLRLRFAVLLLLALATLTRAAGPAAIFVAISDQHSAYQRTAQFVAAVDRLRADNPGVPIAVLIDGDLFEAGNVVAQRSGGAIDLAMVAALARRVPTIVNLGNHDAEFETLPAVVARFTAAGAIVVGNLSDQASGKLVAPASTQLKLGDVSAAIVAVGTNQLAQYRPPVRAALEVPNPVAWAHTHWPTLLAHATVPIVLSHAGLRADRELLPLVPNGTLFVGGHDHLRLVHRLGRTAYVHSGAWNSCLTVARLERDTAGATTWTVEQRVIADTDAADPELAGLVAKTSERWLQPTDLEPVGRLPAALPREAAAHFVLQAVQAAAGADAVFIGNTTFGDGLPAGVVRRVDLDGCVRFDGTVCIAEVEGLQLKTWLAAANATPANAFEHRGGEFLFAEGPAQIDSNRRYRIATTDWGMRNRGRYFGTETLVFVEHPELRLKPIVAKALTPP
jgi:2',3'-cyclic-nucleotide 2'-phosphodiesterase (5'-nucleotidase family)